MAIDAFNRRLATGADDPHTRYYMAALYALQRRRRAGAAASRAAARASWVPFTRWRLPRDPDFAGVLANPAVAARVLPPVAADDAGPRADDAGRALTTTGRARSGFAAVPGMAAGVAQLRHTRALSARVTVAFAPRARRGPAGGW